MLYISTSVWVLRTPNVGRYSHFQRFCCKKPKTSKKFAANFSKKQVFLEFAPERWSTVLLPIKWAFSILRSSQIAWCYSTEDFFMGFLCLVLKNCFKRKGQKERDFFGWIDWHARVQERQANGKNILSYTTWDFSEIDGA